MASDLLRDLVRRSGMTAPLVATYGRLSVGDRRQVIEWATQYLAGPEAKSIRAASMEIARISTRLYELQPALQIAVLNTLAFGPLNDWQGVQ